MQASADQRSRRRHVSRMTDEKGETCNVSLLNVKSEEQARVSSGRLFHARAAATRKARSPRVARRVDGTCSVVVSAEWRHRQLTISDVGRKLSDGYAGVVPRTQWYARTHNRNWIRSRTRNQWSSRSSGVVCSEEDKPSGGIQHYCGMWIGNRTRFSNGTIFNDLEWPYT